MSTRIDFLLEGLNCAHCAEKINDKVSKLDYVENSNMNFVAKKLSVFMENESITEANVSKIEKIMKQFLPKKQEITCPKANTNEMKVIPRV